MNLVFMPGFMLNESLWDDVLPFLDKSDQTIFGDLCSGNSIETIAQANLNKAPESFALIGFSMGGYVAREMVRQAPHRIQSLILIATSARADNDQQALQRITAAKNMSSTNFRGLSQASIKESLGDDSAQNPELIEKIRLMGAGLGKDAFIAQSSIRRTGDVDQLSVIQCPTLVIAGDQDRLRRLDELMELQKGIPHSKLSVIKDCGHMIPLEQAGLLGPMISAWVKQHSSFCL
jgi:pimeloyl-ACP methyl ester carboxylesterase